MRGQLFLVMMLGGCGWVSQAEFDEVWDADGDTWGFVEDCSDTNPLIHPFALDYRGDGCDADCGSSLDSDGDDWPDDVDCEPEDPEIFPCSPFEVEDDGIDFDCDAEDEIRDSDDCDPQDPNAEEGVEAQFIDNCVLDDDWVPPE